MWAEWRQVLERMSSSPNAQSAGKSPLRDMARQRMHGLSHTGSRISIGCPYCGHRFVSKVKRKQGEK